MTGMESTMTMDLLQSILVKFMKVNKILDDSKKSPPENEPIKVKYEAIEILKEMETDIKNASDISTKVEAQLSKMLATVYLNLGILHVDTDEYKLGEKRFMQCLELLKDTKHGPKAIILMVITLNQLGIIWTKWGEPMKAKEFLEEAEEIYNTFTDPSREYCQPISIGMYFGVPNNDEAVEPKKKLESLHTLTLYYLAQVYARLQDHHKSAAYFHRTLHRQLGQTDIMPDLDHIDWALNAAILSQYFIENDGFTEARHHLAAAFCVLQKYEVELKNESKEKGESEMLDAKWENFKHRSADVARCWAKYGIFLINFSRKRLLEEVENEDDDNELKVTVEKKQKAVGDLKFNVLKNDIELIESEITDQYLLDYNDARSVFLNIQKWLEQAKTYYTLESHASDHVLLVRDMSEAYKYLAFFEEQEDRQAKMHKRRIDILENVVKELNPQYYKSACRQIWIELGETYSLILQIKINRLETADEKPTPRALTKINNLAKSAIANFNSFLNSIETHNSETEVKEFPEEILQPALLSYFYLGRLYYKIITPDKRVQFENTQKSLDAYSFVVKYTEKYPKAAELIKAELTISKDFVELLPLKLDRLRQLSAQQ